MRSFQNLLRVGRGTGPMIERIQSLVRADDLLQQTLARTCEEEERIGRRIESFASFLREWGVSDGVGLGRRRVREWDEEEGDDEIDDDDLFGPNVMWPRIRLSSMSQSVVPRLLERLRRRREFLRTEVRRIVGQIKQVRHGQREEILALSRNSVASMQSFTDRLVPPSQAQITRRFFTMYSRDPTAAAAYVNSLKAVGMSPFPRADADER